MLTYRQAGRLILVLISLVVTAVFVTAPRSDAQGNQAIGWFDGAAMVGPGRLTVTGWTFSPSYPGVALQTRVKVNGVTIDDYPIYAIKYRPDVGNVYGSFANYSGFATTVGIKTQGLATICIEALDGFVWINVGVCRPVDTSQYSDSSTGIPDQFFGFQFHRSVPNSDAIPLKYFRVSTLAAPMFAADIQAIDGAFQQWNLNVPRVTATYDASNSSYDNRIQFAKFAYPGYGTALGVTSMYFTNCNPFVDGAGWTPSFIQESCNSWGSYIKLADRVTNGYYAIPLGDQKLIVAHEIGHAMGLTHTLQYSVMRPPTQAAPAPVPISFYDRGAIDALYYRSN